MAVLSLAGGDLMSIQGVETKSLTKNYMRYVSWKIFQWKCIKDSLSSSLKIV